jgi:hypothetical protein
MRVYRVSPIVQYSPFYRLTYFSKLCFELGNICEVDFNKRKILAIVVEVLEMNDAKVSIRQGNFTTKKIETKLEKKDEARFTKEQFSLIQEFADKFLLSVGEVAFALDNLHKQKKFKHFFNKQGEMLGKVEIENFDIEKYIQYQAPNISQVHTLVLYIKILKLEKPLSEPPFKVGDLIFLDSKEESIKAIEFQKSGTKIISLGVICVKN